MGSSAEHARVILFDCDLAVCALTSSLTKAGFEVSVSTASRAAEMEELRPAALVVGLTESTAMASIRAIRHSFRRTPIVLVGPTHRIETYKAAAAAGFTRVLEPSCSAAVLVDALRAALEPRASQLSLIYEANRELFALRDRSRLAETVVRVAMRIMEADTATLFLVGVDAKLYIAHAYGIPDELKGRVRIAVGEGIAGRVAQGKEPTIINGDVRSKPGFTDLRGTGRPHSSILYPLVSAGQLDGLLTLNRIENPRRYTGEDLELASVFAAQVLLAIQNGRLLEQSAQSEKLVSLGQLAHGVAHEINTPTQYVSDSIFFLKEGLEGVHEALELYSQLEHELAGNGLMAKSLERISRHRAAVGLGDIMDTIPEVLSRAQTGVERIGDIVRALKAFAASGTACEWADLNELVETTLAVASSEYASVARVEKALGALPFVYCSPGEMCQALLGLLNNAAQAVAAVRHREGLGHIGVHTCVEGTYAVVRISDDGPGIAPEIRGRIFDPFFTTREIGDGVGMGLSIARTIIVTRHQGELTFDTEVGRGTCFTVRLPVARASDQRGKPSLPRIGGLSNDDDAEHFG